MKMITLHDCYHNESITIFISAIIAIESIDYSGYRTRIYAAGFTFLASETKEEILKLMRNAKP